ncbi:S9 family peptidase [Terricaulis sp.]|uniref:S9 family peptidase n=1 Tax=Terricaulis sp. TaxID=2768686 RepID=UPI0037839BB1
MTERPVPPVARREPKRFEQVGRVRTDDYAWMKDDNWQQVMRDPSLLQPEIRAHLDAENAYREQMMAGTEALQERIYQEMRGRTKEDDSSVPSPDGPWDYYRRFNAGAQHPIHARRPRGQDGPEEILIDVDAQAKGKTYYKVVAAQHAPDHTHFAYAVDEQGSEIYTVYVKDLATGETLAASIGNCTGDFAWSPCSQHLFWIYRDDNGRPAKVYRRPARGGEDTLVYDEPDDGFFLSVHASESHEWIIIHAGHHEASETHLIPAATPTAAPLCFHPREDKLLYSPTHWNGRWYVLTNADGAVDFKVMTAEPGATGRAQWKELLAHEPGRFITALSATKNYLVRAERSNALPRIVIRHSDGEEHAIALAEEAYNLEIAGGYEYDTSIQRYVYESPTTPMRWYDYDMAARAQTLRKEQEIPSGHDASAYEAHRFFAAAADGKQVPITVLMKRGQKLDGTAPLFLYGYGSYGISLDADFSIRRFSLVDRGWIYAIAHVRGGAELGFGWFLDGRGKTKTNTFTDFVACAEELIRRGYGRAGNIVCEGRSAGGLLMGAITNMRPNLWAGVIGGVPFVDVLNTMSDASLPLTPPEWPEWGNPLESAEDYDTIAAYCPYTNISAKPYPAVLSTGGLTDPRVTYWEPTKWAAKLRPHSTSGRPVLLKMNMGAGHAGSAGRFEFLRELAHDYAFALKAVGAEEAGGGF